MLRRMMSVLPALLVALGASGAGKLAIVELNATGIGFLFIEHDLEALTRLVPSMAVMDRGRIIASGTPRFCEPAKFP